MKIALSPEHEALIQKKMASGKYACVDEVVQEAFELLSDRETSREARLAELKRQIALGFEQLERGEYTEYDEAGLRDFFERIKTEGRRKLTERKAASAQ